ncbi:hypothetical protein [Sphingopyxis sp.]|uniref:hypothetical protein n=1 Tax=Sphingopyxis sp. TaxID=1908224 RepID=UPI002EDAA20C
MNWMLLSGALVAIVVMTLTARWLGLGIEPHIADPEHARRLAHEAHFGFQPVDIAISQDGIAALLLGQDDRLMIIRRHGNHFVARLIGPPVSCRLDRQKLILSSGENMFGEVVLDLGDQGRSWADKIRRMEEKCGA